MSTCLCLYRCFVYFMTYFGGAAKAAAQGENISPDNTRLSSSSVFESVLTLMKLMGDRELLKFL